MRIVHIIDTLNPAAGGPATVVARLAAAQASLGHMVTVLSYMDVAERAVVDKNLHSIPSVGKIRFEYLAAHGGMDWALVMSAREALHRLVRGATVVHLHGVWEPLLKLGARYARRHNIPYILRPAGMLDPWSLRQRWFKKFVAMRLGGYRKMFDRSAFMHTLNRDERDLIGRLKLRCAVEVIPNGVFPEEFANLPPAGTFHTTRPELQGQPYALFLSRLHYKKGLDYLAEGFALAARARSDLHLVVAGPDGGAREDFLARVHDAGLSDRVHVVGPLYGADKLAALVDATLFVLPSRQEGFSLAITEALACAKPVVISPECHFPEVADVGAGRVVALDGTEVGKAITEVASDANLRARMGAAGTRLVREHFTWPSIACRTITAYEEVFARRGPAFTVANPKRMHIVHVISSLAVEAGGPPAVCAGLAGAQAALGHRVTIAAVDLSGKKRVPIPPGVEVADFPITGVERYASSPELSKRLAKNGRDVDFFHLHSVWQFPTFAAARVCWKYHKPYVVLLNGMLERYSVSHRHLLLKRLYWKLREHRVLGRAQGLHCLNTAEIAKAMPWISEMPKFVCGNGINASQLEAMPPRGRFRASDERFGQRPLALFMSRIHPKKGLDRLLPAWKDVLARQPDCRLAIAGGGDADYVAQIDRLIAQHDLGRYVFRLGQVAGDAKWQAIVDADVFVLPSHQEGFSMAITESLAAGVPAVATDECNFTQLTTHDCGVEIKGGDMGAFTRAVTDLLADPVRRARMGANGKSLVRTRFTWEGIVADLQHVYEWIIAGRPMPPDGADVWRPTSPNGESPSFDRDPLHTPAAALSPAGLAAR